MLSVARSGAGDRTRAGFITGPGVGTEDMVEVVAVLELGAGAKDMAEVTSAAGTVAEDMAEAAAGAGAGAEDMADVLDVATIAGVGSVAGGMAEVIAAS